MSYQALYRKYRPSTLKDVIGQDVVIKILKNAVINNKVGHAYLFSGPRGIGKTTIAKAFAKTVNCLDLKDGISCEKCKNCKAINETLCPDIIEIDAASNNGVDEIREIKNKINLVPSELKYKVYIIDEVHMLSIGAFNALLKTLEEPPEHIIFILATTDLQKVPATIISRCQCFEFHRISKENIVERLKYIIKTEKLKVDDEVLVRIAELSDGGLRDAVGMLDKLSAYSTDNITLDDFEKVNGIVSIEDKEKFLDYLHDGNVSELIKFIDQIYDNGKDLIIFVQDMLEMCKNKTIDYYLNNSNVDVKFLLDLANVLNEVSKTIKITTDVKTILEINLLSFMNRNNKQVVVEKVVEEKTIEKESTKPVEKEVKEEQIISQEIISEKITEEDNISNNEICKQIVNNCFAKASKTLKQEFEENWKKISDYALDSKLGAAASFISDAKICAVSENELVLSFEYNSMIERGYNLLDKIQNLLDKVYNKEYDIAFLTYEQWENEKKEFIENKNNGITYEYKPIEHKKEKKVSKKKEETITSQAIELFGDDMIAVN